MTEHELKIIRSRVRKLLALSKSPNENEAFSALEKAQSIMSSYGLNKNEFLDYKIQRVKSTKRAVEWRTVLANAIENLYATYHYRDVNDGTFVFCGEELDVLMASEMYSYLVKAVDRIARNSIRKNAKYKYRQSFRAGIASRIWERMDELGQSCSWRNPKELSKKQSEISTWVHAQKELTDSSPKTTKANMKAFVRGEIAGNKVSLSRQMNASHGRYIESREAAE